MDAVSSQTRVRTCSGCQGDAEYFCKSHGCDICTECSLENESGSNNLETTDHDLIVYRNKLCINLHQEICKRHPQSVYENFCEFCELPICSQCKGHETHKQSDIKTGPKRHCNDNDINLMKKLLLYLLFCQPSNCQKFGILNLNISKIRTNILKKANEQKSRVDSIAKDLAVKHSCPNMKIKIKEHLDRIQTYEHFIEHSAIKPVHFLLLRKKIAVPKKRFALHTSNEHMTKSFNKEKVMESLAIRITEKEKKTVNLNVLEKYKHVIKINRYPKQVTNILLDTTFLEFAAVGVRQLRGRFDLLEKIYPLKPDLLDLSEKTYPEEFKDTLRKMYPINPDLLDLSEEEDTEELKDILQQTCLEGREPFVVNMLDLLSKKDFRDELLGFFKEISENKTEMEPLLQSEEEKKLVRGIRKLFPCILQFANIFDPMMSQIFIEFMNLVDPPENMEA